MSDIWDQVAQGTITAPAQAGSAPAPAGDMWDQVARGQISSASASAAATQPNAHAVMTSAENPISGFIEGYSRQAIGNAVGATAGGLRALWDLARGGTIEQAQGALSGTQRAVSGFTAPENPSQSAGAATASSNWNPLNWPGVALNWSGKKLEQGAEMLGLDPHVHPVVAGLIESAPAVAATLYAARGLLKSAKPYEVEAESTAAPTQAGVPPEPDSPPIEGGMPEAVQAQRRAILDRVGIAEKRKSAVAGNAQDAATDYQSTKFDEPAGRAMAAQFEHERDAMSGFTQQQISKVGGTVGTDEDALINRGATIAKPFEQLRGWFTDRMRQLYADANARSQGMPVTDLPSVDQTLTSPTFVNTLLAKNQQGLLGAIKAQLEHFRSTSTNSGGFDPAGAEQFRQWLNQIWSPENKWAIGQVKDAVDHDVFAAAGEDLFGQARAVKTLEAKTFEAPGVSDLFDANPKTGALVLDAAQIPDRLLRLQPGAFQTVIRSLQEMPPELQGEAQAALGEVRGQLLNRMLKAGTETRSGRGAQVWRAEDVSQVLARHAAKFRIAFDGLPAEQAAIQDINSAGQILRADQGYPGAYAQAANATRRGLGASVIRNAARVGGAAIGGTVGAGVGLPGVGAMAGELAGNAAGESMASAAAEKAALKSMRKRIEMPQ